MSIFSSRHNIECSMYGNALSIALNNKYIHKPFMIIPIQRRTLVDLEASYGVFSSDDQPFRNRQKWLFLILHVMYADQYMYKHEIASSREQHNNCVSKIFSHNV